MKRAFQIVVLVSLVSLFFVGCEKEKTITLCATTERYHGTEKVYIDNDHYACWNNGDNVRINYANREVQVTTNTDGSTSVTIPSVPISQDNQGYYALYPSTLYQSDRVQNNIPITIPSIQEYNESNGHQVLSAPMAAKADNNNILKFKNLCFLLKVHIPPVNNSLKAIKVKSPDGTILSGTGTLTFDNTDDPTLTMTSGSDEVTLHFSTTVSLNVEGGSDFYIALPSLAAEKTLRIITQDIVNDHKMVEISSTRDIPSNVIIGIDGPTVANFEGYEIYDWIYSQKSGRIDLGIQPAVGDRMELTFMIEGSETVNTEAQYLAGSRTGNVRWFALSGCKNDTTKGFRIAVAGKDKDIIALGPRKRGEKYLFAGSILQDSPGNPIYGTSTLQNLTDGTSTRMNVPNSSYTSFPSNASNVFLFYEPDAGYHSGMKCYRLRYYQGTTMIHDLIPCKRMSDGAKGMYDIAQSTFIVPTKRSTTATDFILGND